MSGPFRVRLAIAGLLVLVALGLVTPPVLRAAPPVPEIVSTAWSIKFEPGDLQLVGIRQVDGSFQWYWCLPYKVTNLGKEDLFFAPDVAVSDDDGKIVSVDVDVPLRVFEVVKRRLANPLLETHLQVLGKLLQGPDNARESVFIWPMSKNRVDRMSIFIAGLSGETTTIQSPTSGESVTLRKTLMLEYALPGDPQSPQQTTIQLQNPKWIMR